MIKPAIKGQDGLNECKKADRVLVITKRKQSDSILSCLLIKGVLRKVRASSGKDMAEGNICIMKITELKENMGAAFGMIKGKQKCFIKISELSDKFNLTAKNRPPKCGDNYLVRIKSLPSKGKLSTATTKLSGLCEDTDALLEKAAHLADFSVLKDKTWNFLDEFFKTESMIPERVVTDLKDNFEDISDFIRENIPAYKGDIELYQDNLVSLSVLYSLESKISEALEKKVWLKSGGYLYIEPTEAMTVIDVNSGKYDKRKEEESAILEQNLEAAKEVARQITLRNLSGIIIVDFINMKSALDQIKLMEFTQNCLNEDTNPGFVIDITKLHLMEITRKKMNKTLNEQFFG